MNDPIVFVLKVPFTEREVTVLDELSARLRVSTVDVVRVALWRLAEGCHVEVLHGDFAVPSPPTPETE